MRRIRSAALVAFVTGAVVMTSTPAVAGTDLHVTGWALPSASNALIARNTGLDTLSVVGVSINAAGSRVTAVPDDSKRLRRTADDHGLRAELLINNWSNRLEDFDPRALHRMLSHPARLRAVADQAARRVASGGWDGLNVDFERLRAADGAEFVTLLERLRAKLPDGAALSVDVSARQSLASYREAGYRLGAIARVVDLVQLMTYDLHGPTWSGPGAIGDLRWQRRCLDAALQRVPADKLDLGIAGYGYTWPEVGTGRSLTVRQARRLVDDDGATAEWDDDAGEWTATLSDGTVVWWSDGDSYDLRRDLATSHGLHGVAVWRVGSADTLT